MTHETVSDPTLISNLVLNNQFFLGESLIAYVQALEMAGEPLLALAVLENRPPLLRQVGSALASYETALRAKVQHAASDAAYMERYRQADFQPLADPKLLTLPRYRAVRKVIEDMKPESVTSIGPGSGNFEHSLLRDGLTEAVHLVDVAETVHELRAAIGGATCSATKTAHPYHFPDPPASFVICLEVLEHLPNPVAFAGTLSHAVAPGGTLVLTTPAAEFWVESQIPSRTDGWYWHLTSQTRETLGQLLVDAGFSQARVAFTQEGHLLAIATK